MVKLKERALDKKRKKKTTELAVLSLSVSKNESKRSQTSKKAQKRKS